MPAHSEHDPQVRSPITLIKADGGRVLLAWVFAILWNAVAWVVLFGVLSEATAPTPVIVAVALFPLIGLLGLWFALMTTARRLRHGRPQLHVDSGTLTTGSQPIVSVLTHTAPRPDDRLDASLVVIRRVTSGSGKSRNTSEHILWRCPLAIELHAGSAKGLGWSQTVTLPLPSDLPPTAGDVFWRLEWQLIRPGLDLSATFTLPVAAGDGSRVLNMSDLEAQIDRASPLAALERAGISLDEHHDSLTIRLGAWRNPSVHVTGLIAATIVTAIAVVCWTELSPWTALLSTPIVLLIWRGALRSCCWRSTINLSPTQIVVDAGWWRLCHTEVATAAVLQVDRQSTMKTNGNAWYDLDLITADAQRIRVARCVPERASARLAEMITAILPTTKRQ